MVLTVKEIIILIIYYLLIASGLLMVLGKIFMLKYGEALAGISVYLFIALSFEVDSIKKRIKAREFRESR